LKASPQAIQPASSSARTPALLCFECHTAQKDHEDQYSGFGQPLWPQDA
jgi:hypothetical protein